VSRGAHGVVGMASLASLTGRDMVSVERMARCDQRAAKEERLSWYRTSHAVP